MEFEPITETSNPGFISPLEFKLIADTKIIAVGVYEDLHTSGMSRFSQDDSSHEPTKYHISLRKRKNPDVIGLDFVKQISSIYLNIQIEQNGPIPTTWVELEEFRAKRDVEVEEFYEANKDLVDDTLQGFLK